MRKAIKSIMVSTQLVASTFPALALPQADCEKSWNAYDINRDGRLSGEEAKRFIDDMAGKGVTVWTAANGSIGPQQYNNACVNDFWAKDAPQ
jgi:uncharacterized protein YvpB